MKKLILLLTALCCAASIFAATITTEIDGIYYSLNDATMKATVNSKPSESPAYSGVITIPSQVMYEGDTYTVYSIGFNAFGNTSVTAITLPETITSIGDYAFWKCFSLNTLNIPSGLTSIGRYSFYGVNFKSAVIPGTVTNIPYYAFGGCNMLSSLTISEGVQTIGQMAFWALNSMDYQDLVLPSTIQKICTTAFQATYYLNSVTCLAMTPPDLEAGAFEDMVFGQTLYVPDPAYDDYVNHAQWGKFAKIQALPTPPVTIDGITYSRRAKLQAAVIAGETRYTGDITIPETVTIENTTYTVSIIDDEAFKNCWNVTSVRLPNTIKTIGKDAFLSCEGMKSINLPEGLTSIDDYGLSGCRGLTGLTLPSTLKTLGTRALSGLASVVYIKCLSKVPPTPVFGDNCFNGVNLGFSLPFYVPDAYMDNYKSVNSVFSNFNHLPLSSFALNGIKVGNFYYDVVGTEATLIPTKGSDYMTGVIPDNITVEGDTYAVTAIADEAFMNRPVSTYSLPAHLKTIGARAFKNCFMEDLVLPATVTSIGVDAFADCYYLRTITVEAGNTYYDARDGSNALIETASNTLLRASKATTAIPATVTAIAANSFSYMNGLTEVMVPEGVTTIGANSFYECRNLRTITLPSTLTSLGASAMKTCLSLSEITVTAPVPPTCGEDCFNGVPISAKLTVPYGKSAAYKAANGWSAFTNVEEIPLPTYAINHGTHTSCTITSPEQGDRFEAGAQVTVVVTPDLGYRVTSISVVRTDNSEAVTVTDGKFIMPATEVTISATASNIYTITVDNAEHGTVSVSATSIAEGNTVYITATPDAGYELDHYVVDGKNLELSAFTMPAKDIHVTAVFRKIQYSAQVLNTYFCTASCSPETAAAGTVITVSYTPDTNYSLDSIVVRRQDNNALIPVNNAQFTMPEAHVGIRVYCSANKFNISKGVTEHGSFEVPANATMGSVVTITATPDAGYSVDYYEVDGAKQVANTFTMPAKDITVNVIFRANTYMVTVNATHCAVSYLPAGQMLATDTEVAVTVTPDEDYHFVSLKVTDDQDKEITVTDGKFTMPASAITITAVCEQNVYTVTVLPVEHGTLTADKTTDVAAGTKVTLTATPDEGYEVSKYTLDGVDLYYDNFTMPAKNVTVGVVFVQTEYTATVELHENCDITVAPEHLYFGTQVTLTITPTDEKGELLTLTVLRADNEEEITVTDNQFTMPACNVKIYATCSLETALHNAEATLQVSKTLVNGQLLITREGKTYNAQGAQVK